MADLIAGIDEAGRGPVIGPMVLSICACSSSTANTLYDAGARDSKLLSSAKRDELKSLIQSSCLHSTTVVSPADIDTALFSPSSSLTTLSAFRSARLIKSLHRKLSSADTLSRVILDLPSKSAQSYTALVRSFLPPSLRSISLHAVHRADIDFVQVSCASILAKTTRDRRIASLSKSLSLSLGSGYPSDPVTKRILQTHLSTLEQNNILRTSWSTVRRLKEAGSQKTLVDSY